MEQLELQLNGFPRVKYLPKNGERFVEFYNKVIKTGKVQREDVGFDVYMNDTYFFFVPVNVPGYHGIDKRMHTDESGTLVAVERSPDRCCEKLCLQCYVENWTWKRSKS